MAAEKAEKTKEERISKEFSRLKRLFTKMPDKTKKAVEKLIKNAAFMGITLEDLQEKINTDGPVSEYKNGENQFGTKKSPEVEIYNTMIKNYAAVIKQLTDLIPHEEDKPKVDEFDKFVNSRE
jgi:intergrase/recombinase